MDYAAAILKRLPQGWRSTGIGELVNLAQSYLGEDDIAGITAAYEFSANAHGDQRRLTGEPYVSHPVAVAHILAELRLDADTLKAALLHDVLEDTPTTVPDLVEAFGADVSQLVEGVSKLEHIHFDSYEQAQAEGFRKMLLAMVEDLRVILVKLADRTHNMRTLSVFAPKKQQRIARETLEIYAPIANRLGINSLKVELEDLGFKYLHPYRYRALANALSRAAGDQRQFLRKIETRLTKALKEAGIAHRVVGRNKRLYSVYRKMRTKQRSLTEIADLFGFRLIVENVDACYRTLGLAHRLFKPMPGRFKDYIAIPRVNGYQSLHTTLVGPNGIPLEIQIRTEEMDRLAERGIAAHWQYKAVEKQTHSAEARAREWLAGLMEMEHVESSEEFLETVKVDLFPDKIYVFTPKGKILRLPRGATAVDFAYAVHTGVGNRCVAAKVDRQLVPLRTVLTSGQTVEIITARGAKPNPNWVNFVVTAKARNAIRGYLRNLQEGEAEELGKRLLGQALKAQSISLRRIKKAALKELLGEFELESVHELYRRIGLGERLAAVVAGQLLGKMAAKTDDAKGVAVAPLVIAGTEGMVVNYARCCHPIPGDDIIGYMSSGRGLVVHRAACGNVGNFRKQPAQWINVRWKRNVKLSFQAGIVVRSLNRMGLLAEMATVIATAQCDIDHVAVETDSDSSTIEFLLRVRDRDHLARVIRGIRAMPDVVRITRPIPTKRS